MSPARFEAAFPEFNPFHATADISRSVTNVLNNFMNSVFNNVREGDTPAAFCLFREFYK
jgi:hypothetical protein